MLTTSIHSVHLEFTVQFFHCTRDALVASFVMLHLVMSSDLAESRTAGSICNVQKHHTYQVCKFLLTHLLVFLLVASARSCTAHPNTLVGTLVTGWGRKLF